MSEIKSVKQEALQKAIDQEKNEIIDWINDNVDDVFNIVAETIEQGSLNNQDVYDSIFMKIDQIKTLKNNVKDSAQSDFDFASQDLLKNEGEDEVVINEKRAEVEDVSIEFHDQIKEFQREINKIKQNISIEEMVVLKTLKTEFEQLKQTG